MIRVIEKQRFSATLECAICRKIYEVKNFYDAKKSKTGHLCNECTFVISKHSGPITKEYLRQHFDYVPLTGAFTYKFDSFIGSSGEDATIKHSGGYLISRIGGKDYLVHRLIAIYMTGSASDEIDHVNHIRDDNSWENLRLVDRLGNSRNTSIQKNTSTGVMGVSLHKPTGKYRAYINKDRKHTHLGLFNTIEEAKAARESAVVEYGFHNNHGL